VLLSWRGKDNYTRLEHSFSLFSDYDPFTLKDVDLTLPRMAVKRGEASENPLEEPHSKALYTYVLRRQQSNG